MPKSLFNDLMIKHALILLESRRLWLEYVQIKKDQSVAKNA